VKDQKQCSKCAEVKRLAEFSLDSRGKFGLRSYCKACAVVEQMIYYAQNKEKYAAQSKAYRKANKEEISEQKRIYGQEHKEEIAGRNKAYRTANKEKVATQKKIWTERNKGKVNAIKRAYRHTLKGRIARKIYMQTCKGKAIYKASNHKRRARGQFSFDTPATRTDFLSWERGKIICYLTGNPLESGKVWWDHVIPLRWGGTNDAWNFLPASRSANCSKHYRLVYFDISSREARYTTNPCPGGTGPNGETWPRLPLTQPSFEEMEQMVNAWKERRKEVRHAA